METINSFEGFELNDKLKELGAESDVIDINKLQELKPNIISSPDVDEDAF